MPVGVNNLINQWFANKELDTNGDGKISREELSVYTNNAAKKPANEQTWEEALGGKLIHSADNNGGESFYDIASKLDGEAGLSQKDLTILAAKAGKKDEIGGDDFQFLATSQPTPQKDTQKPAEGSNITVKMGDCLWEIAKQLKKGHPGYANKLITDIIKTIQTANNIKDPNLIIAGNKLFIPTLQ